MMAAMHIGRGFELWCFRSHNDTYSAPSESSKGANYNGKTSFCQVMPFTKKYQKLF